jgi:hypothetical protein
MQIMHTSFSDVAVFPHVPCTQHTTLAQPTTSLHREGPTVPCMVHSPPPYKQPSILQLQHTPSQRLHQLSKEKHAMASVPKLLLLVLCSYQTLVTHAGGDDHSRSYKVVSIGSLKSGSVVCTEPEGTVQYCPCTHLDFVHSVGDNPTEETDVIS